MIVDIKIKKASLVVFFFFLSIMFAQRNIYHIPPPNAQLGEDLVVKVSLLDIETPIKGTLYYRSPKGKSYLEIPFVDTGFNWEATLPSFSLTEDGIEYLITFQFGNEKILSFPRVDPFNNPIFVRTVDEDNYFGEPLESDIIILSPFTNANLNTNNPVIAVSFFNATEINRSSVELFLDGIDMSSKYIFDGDILVYAAKGLQNGLHKVESRSKDLDDQIIKPLIWSFSVKEFIDKESNNISYFGNINSRLTAEKIVDSEINIAEVSGKFSLDAQWARLDNSIRISSKESIFNQPYDRLSSNLSFGRFLEVQIGDFFPQFTNLTIDGKRVRGLGLDVDFNWLRFQLINGELNRAVQRKSGINGAYNLLYDLTNNETDGTKTYYLDRTGFEFKRGIYGARLSTNLFKKIELGAQLLKIRDDTTSVSREISDANFFVNSSIDGIKSGNYNLDTFQTQLSLNNHNLFTPSSNWKGIKPQDNLIVGFNIGTFLDDRKIAIDFDWNLSLYNKDIWDGALSIAQLDTSIDDSLDGFIGRTYDENGDPIVSSSEISTDQIPLDPGKMKDIFIINTNMTPLIPIDYTIMKSSPLRAIINMPSSAFKFSIRGKYNRNNILLEYQQIGPEYISLANPFLRNNSRNFTLQNRIGFLNQKVFVNIGFKHRDNKILSTVVNPLNTNTFFLNATFLPGPSLPTFSYNFQSINKNNEKTNLDSVGSKIVDLREDSDATTSVLALTYPFDSGNIKNNITINYGNVINLDNFASKRDESFFFAKTNSNILSFNLSSIFSSSLRTYALFNKTSLEIPTFENNLFTKLPYTLTSLSFNITRKFLGEKLVSKNEASLLNSKGKNSSTLLGLRSGVDYYVREDLNLNLVAYLRFSYSKNSVENDRKIDINASGITLIMLYRF